MVEIVAAQIEQAAGEHREALLRFAWLRTGSAEDAQDIVQSALMKAMVALRGGHRPNNLKAWLMTIAYHEVCASKRRGKSLRRKLLRLLVRPTPSPDPLQQDLREALADIPEPYGPVLILRFVQDFSVQEIAEILDMPAGTTKVYVWRGLRMLREKLRKTK